MVGNYLFYIGNIGVPSMGFCILIGTIFAVLLCYWAKRFSNLDWNDEILDGIIWAVLGGFVGMKLLYWIVTPDVFLDVFRNFSWKALWDLITSGMVFYGGLIGGVIGLLLLCLKKKRNFFTFSDLIVPCFCVAHAGGRIGCLLVGCCYGVAEGESCLGGLCTYDGTLAVTYLNGVRRLPVPLMESLFLLLLAAALILILKNNKHRGAVTAWYLMLYAAWRFVIEYFRDDEIRGIYGPFSTSQWIGIAIFVAGVVIFVLSRKWPKDEPLPETNPFEQRSSVRETNEEPLQAQSFDIPTAKGSDEDEYLSDEEVASAPEMAEDVPEYSQSAPENTATAVSGEESAPSGDEF